MNYLKFQFIAVLFFINIVLLFCGTSKSSEAYQYFLDGEYEFLNNNYLKAEKYYTKALSISPNSPTILQSLVDVNLYQGENDLAINYLDKILNLEPYNKKSGLAFYELLNKKGDIEKSKVVLDTLIKYHPMDLDILFYKASIYYSEHNWIDLLNTYKKIFLLDSEKENLLIKIYEIGIVTENIDLVKNILLDLKEDHDNYVIIELLIEIAESNRNYQEAIILISELINKSGESYELKLKLSEYYLNQKKYNNVLEILNPLYLEGQASLDVLRMLLISFSMLDQNENEINIGKVLVEKYPHLTIGYEALSFSYLQAGNNNLAIEVLLNAIYEFPDEIIFPYTIATIYSSLGNYKKAKSYYHQTLSLKSDFISAQHGLAMIYEEMNDIYRSDSLFTDMINKNKYDAIGQNDYAYILSERKNITNEELMFALNLAENAISLEPDNSAFMDTIGWIYYKLGEYDLAEKYIKKSLSIDDTNVVVLEHMGDIYMKLEKEEDAIEVYQRILLIDSNNIIINEKMKNIYE